MSRYVRRIAAVLVLATGLGLLPSREAAALPLRPAAWDERADFAPRGLLAHLWRALSSLWGRAGADLDPDGKDFPPPRR